MEIWKFVLGFETHYQISNYGNVKSLDRTKLSSHGSRSKLKSQNIKPVLQKKTGYQMITLRNDTVTQPKLLHRLVALHFLDNKDNKPCINHIDGIKTNNMANNLEWCTYKENSHHAFLTGLCNTQMLPIVGTNIIDGTKLYFNSISDAAKFLNGSKSNIHKCLKNQYNRTVAYDYKWEYHISHNLISKIQSPLTHISL